MKDVLFALMMIVSTAACSQKKITQENYYDYYVKFEQKETKGIIGDRIGTGWLSKLEVIPIIYDEFKKAGYEAVFTNKLFKVNDSQYIVLSAYNRKANFGFLYVEGHNAIPEKKDRINLNHRDEYGTDYLIYEETPTGKPNMIYIDKLPENIFLLNENCYWFQFTDNPKDSDKFFSKKDAIEILKKDVRQYLSKMK